MAVVTRKANKTAQNGSASAMASEQSSGKAAKVYYNPENLPRFENIVCFAIWIAHAAFFAPFFTWKASGEKLNQIRHYLIPSPYVSGLTYDASDAEWVFYKANLFRYILFYTAHWLTFNLVSLRITTKYFIYFNMFTWISLHICLVGWKSTLFIATVAALLGLIARKSGRIIPVWIVCLGFVLKSTDIAPYEQKSSIFYMQFNFYLYSAIKIINMCSFLVNNPNQSVKSHWKNFIQYLFYPPYTMTLIVLYEDFSRQFELRSKANNYSIKRLIYEGLRVVFWFLFIETILHFFYMNAFFSNQSHILSSMDNYRISSIAFLAGQFFHLKYVVIFGTNSFFAMLDNMVPPGPPICIARVSKYSIMWRQFDKGLYQFLKNQVYLPLIGLNFCIWRRLLAMLVAFGFVLAWHGSSSKYVWWVGISVIEITIERVTSGLYQNQIYRNKLNSVLSPMSQRRIYGWLLLATVIPGIFSVFYFLGVQGIGATVMQKVLADGILQSVTGTVFWTDHGPTAGFVFIHLIILGYFFNQACVTMEKWQLVKHKEEASDRKML